MSAELEAKLREVYNTFNTKYLHEIVDIFRREFTEENVDLIRATPNRFNTFSEYFNDRFAVYDVDGESIILCSYDCANANGYEHLYNISEIEDFGEYSLEDVFNTLQLNDLFGAMNDFIKTSTILVHFPLVKVTNERGQYTYIKHFFAKVPIYNNGKLTNDRFKLNRAVYSYAHFINGYMHSHVSIIPTHNFEEFQPCCTGSGPINTTMDHLRNRPYNESEWMQFCWDLAKYVTVESEEGRPYHYLKRCNTPYVKGDEIKITDLGVTLSKSEYPSYFNLARRARIPEDFWKNFVKYLIVNKVPKFRWANKQWEIAECPTDYVKTISNAFLRYYKENIDTLLERNITLTTFTEYQYLRKVMVDVNGIFTFTGNGLSSIIDSSRDKPVVKFKGVEYKVVIEDRPAGSPESCQMILDVKIIAYITGCLLKILNTKYGKRSEDSTSEPEIQFEDF